MRPAYDRPSLASVSPQESVASLGDRIADLSAEAGCAPRWRSVRQSGAVVLRSSDPAGVVGWRGRQVPVMAKALLVAGAKSTKTSVQAGM